MRASAKTDDRVPGTPNYIVTGVEVETLRQTLQPRDFDHVLEMRDIPQRTPGWFHVRALRLTGSTMGQSLRDPLGLTREKINPQFNGNRYTDYGTRHEDDARRIYDIRARHDFLRAGASMVYFEDFGLTVSMDYGELGNSTDGLMNVLWRPEAAEAYIASRRRYVSHRDEAGSMEAVREMFAGEDIEIFEHVHEPALERRITDALDGGEFVQERFHVEIKCLQKWPLEQKFDHCCQTQSAMALNLERDGSRTATTCKYIVWFPWGTILWTMDLNEQRFYSWQLPGMRRWWSKSFAPAHILKERGLLTDDALIPVIEVTV